MDVDDDELVFDGGLCLQTSFERAVALASVPRGACGILRVESTPGDGTTRRVDGVSAEVRRRMINAYYISLQFTGKAGRAGILS